MFVSTSAATAIQVFAIPAPRPADGRPAPTALPAPLALGRFVELPQPVPQVEDRRPVVRGLDPDRVPGRRPGDLVAGPDPVPLRDRLGQRHLELARDPGHVLTLARMQSLSTSVHAMRPSPPPPQPRRWRRCS